MSPCSGSVGNGGCVPLLKWSERMKKQREHYTPEEKVAILRRHLLEKAPISELCDKQGLQPTVFYRWQKEFFENGAAAFEQKARPNHSAEQERIVYLEGRMKPQKFLGPVAVLFGIVSAFAQPPKTWDAKALADWATPVAGLNVRPGHFSEEEYYRAPIDHLRTY